MTLAERIRMDKQGEKTFNATEFMESVEGFFITHNYDTWLTIATSDTMHGKEAYNVEPWDKNSILYVRPEHLHKLLNLLMDEGFSVYMKNQDNYKVSLMDAPIIEYGQNVWSRIIHKFKF